MIHVVNKRWHTPTPDDFYIGRGSVFGNPYSHLHTSKALYKTGTREEAIEKYKDWFAKERVSSTLMRDTLAAMLDSINRGDDLYLVCFCSPAPCHGRIIKEYLEEKLSVYKNEVS